MDDEQIPVSRRKYKPKTRAPLGYVSENRAAWVDVGSYQFQLIERPAEGDETEYGDGLPVIALGIRKQHGQPFFGILSSLTEQEVEELDKFWQYTIEELRSVTAHLDQRAEIERQKGDDTLSRLYRPVARFIERRRHGIEHPARLSERPDGVLEVEPQSSNSAERVADSGESLDERDTRPGSTQDGTAALD